MEIISLGDTALMVRVPDDFASDPEGTLQAVLDWQRRLEAAAIPGMVECAPAYDSIGVFFDPAQASEAGAPPDNLFGWMKTQIRAVLSTPQTREKAEAVMPLVEVPVSYESEFALDLEEVARHTGLSAGEVAQRHSAADYRVHCVGFTPGFPYLGGLPSELATPRRASPRREVPAGSIAIGGAQTGIYPTASPGGWNVIGRTPLCLFDAQRQPPSLLIAGMRVRFRAITRAEFDALGP